MSRSMHDSGASAPDRRKSPCCEHVCTAPVPAAETALYRLFNIDGDLLYAGVTSDLTRRLLDHYRDKKWFDDITALHVTRHPDRASALDAEADLIATERPAYNAAGNPDYVFSTGGVSRWSLNYRTYRSLARVVNGVSAHDIVAALIGSATECVAEQVAS